MLRKIKSKLQVAEKKTVVPAATVAAPAEVEEEVCQKKSFVLDKATNEQPKVNGVHEAPEEIKYPEPTPKVYIVF